jgi:cellobiose phosphorylase
MLLKLEDDNPPLAAPVGPPERGRAIMGEHFADIMQELNANSDEVASLHAQRSDRDAVIRNAEAHARSAEEALRFKSQQREVAISMAREVASGQTVVLHQLEQRAENRMVEQAAQAGRITTMYNDAEHQIFSLEHMVRDAKAKSEEISQLLSGSVLAVFALECPLKYGSPL